MSGSVVIEVPLAGESANAASARAAAVRAVTVASTVAANVAPALAHAARTDNPHSTTAAQIGFRLFRPTGGNDAPAIQAALDALPVGAALQLEAGATYNLLSGLTVTNGRGLEGNGAALNFLLASETTDALTIVGAVERDNGSQRSALIQNFRVQMSGSGRDGIRLRSADHPRLNGVVIYNPGRDGVRFEPGGEWEWIENYSLINVQVWNPAECGFRWRIPTGITNGNFINVGILLNCEARNCGINELRIESESTIAGQKVSELVIDRGEWDAVSRAGGAVTGDNSGMYIHFAPGAHAVYLTLRDNTFEATSRVGPLSGPCVGTNDPARMIHCRVEGLLSYNFTGVLQSPELWEGLVWLGPQGIRWFGEDQALTNLETPLFQYQMDIRGRAHFSDGADNEVYIGLSGANAYGGRNGGYGWHGYGAATSYHASVYGLFGWYANSTGPNLALSKSRGDALGVHSAVQVNDEIGTLSFAGSDGSNFWDGAAVVGLADSTPGTFGMSGRLSLRVRSRDVQFAAERLGISYAAITAAVPITLPGAPSQANHAATKGYADGLVAGLSSGVLFPRAKIGVSVAQGATTSGAITMPALTGNFAFYSRKLRLDAFNSGPNFGAASAEFLLGFLRDTSVSGSARVSQIAFASGASNNAGAPPVFGSTPNGVNFPTGGLLNLAISNVATDGSSFDLSVTNADTSAGSIWTVWATLLP